MAADAKGQSWAILAASEMGKGVWLKKRLDADKPDRLLIWDTNDEYDRQARAVSSFSAMLRGMAAPSFALRFTSRAKKDKDLRADFEDFCTIAYAAAGASARRARLKTRHSHQPGVHVVGRNSDFAEEV